MEPLSVAQVENVLVPFFKTRPEVTFAYLFGSVARGTAGKLSDIDIAIFIDPSRLPPVGSFGYQSEIIVDLQALLQRDVDVVILNDASTMIRFQVLKHGKLVFCRSDSERRLFHEKAVTQYLDIKPLLQVQRHYLHKQLDEGTFGGGKSG